MSVAGKGDRRRPELIKGAYNAHYMSIDWTKKALNNEKHTKSVKKSSKTAKIRQKKA